MTGAAPQNNFTHTDTCIHMLRVHACVEEGRNTQNMHRVFSGPKES